MTRDPQRNFLKAWREHRRMTQAQLAGAIGTNGAVISLLESGDRGLSSKWLRKIAPVLGATPDLLLEHHPDDQSAEFLHVWADIPPDQREQALDVLKAFRKKAAR